MCLNAQKTCLGKKFCTTVFFFFSVTIGIFSYVKDYYYVHNIRILFVTQDTVTLAEQILSFLTISVFIWWRRMFPSLLLLAQFFFSDGTSQRFNCQELFCCFAGAQWLPWGPDVSDSHRWSVWTETRWVLVWESRYPLLQHDLCTDQGQEQRQGGRFYRVEQGQSLESGSNSERSKYCKGVGWRKVTNRNNCGGDIAV